MAVVPPNELYKSLRTEYAVANTYARHLTELNWQVGSILVGGSLAAVAISFSAKERIPTVFVSFASIVAIIAWFLFLRRNRSFGYIADKRMRYIESQLGLVWGLNNWLDFEKGYAARPIGYNTAIFLAAGLISVLLALLGYLLLSFLIPLPIQ